MGIQRVFVACLLLFISYARADEYRHLVVKGETLSGILEKHKLFPIYGPEGSLAQVLQSNPKIKSPGDRIYAGDEIVIQVHPFQTIEEVHEEVLPRDIAIQAPQTLKELKSEFEPYSEISLSMGGSFLSIESEDTSNDSMGKLGSSLAPSYQLIWSPRINEKFSVDMGFQHKSFSMSEPVKRELKPKKHSLQRFFLGLNYQWRDSLWIEVQGGKEEKLFYRALDANSIQLETSSLTFLQTGLNYKLVEKSKMTYALKGGLKFFFPFENDHYDSELSTGYYGSFLAEQRLKKVTLFGEAFYSYAKFNVDPVNFTQHETGLLLGVRYRIGEDK